MVRGVRRVTGELLAGDDGKAVWPATDMQSAIGACRAWLHVGLFIVHTTKSMACYTHMWQPRARPAFPEIETLRAD